MNVPVCFTAVVVTNQAFSASLVSSVINKPTYKQTNKRATESGLRINNLDDQIFRAARGKSNECGEIHLQFPRSLVHSLGRTGAVFQLRMRTRRD